MRPEAVRLREGAAMLGEALSDGQVDQLLAYLDLLQRWNATYNLTAVREREAMLTQHLLDCIAVVPALRRWLAQSHAAAARVLDVGSGGGLPGVVLAALVEGVEVTCVDTVGKKAAFVQQVAGTLGLQRLASLHGRVEQLKVAPFQLITARAFATLADLVRLTRQHLAPGGCWMALKGKRPDDEIAALATAQPEVAVFHVEQLVVPGLDAERHLVWLRPQPAA
jgi:16S rRNA (guanine527-N7)-methyltransferase